MFKTIKSIFSAPAKLEIVANVLNEAMTLTAAGHTDHDDRIKKLEGDFKHIDARFEIRPTKADLLTLEMHQQDQIDQLKAQVADLTQRLDTQDAFKAVEEAKPVKAPKPRKATVTDASGTEADLEVTGETLASIARLEAALQTKPVNEAIAIAREADIKVVTSKAPKSKGPKS